MQIGDNLHEMSKPVILEKFKRNISGYLLHFFTQHSKQAINMTSKCKISDIILFFLQSFKNPIP